MNTRYRCHACGTTFPAWAPAQRHADTARHHRIELVVTDRNQTGPKSTQRRTQ